MRIILLDGNEIKTKADVHSKFADALDLPDHYGRNLDALHDVLTESGEETGVIAVNIEIMSENLGKWWESLKRMLTDVESERERFHVCFDPFGKEDRK